MTALHAASQPAAPYAACAVNSNAINSTGLGHAAAKLLAYRLHSGIFVEKCHFVVMTTPFHSFIYLLRTVDKHDIKQITSRTARLTAALTTALNVT